MIKTITFSDLDSYWERTKGKAMNDFAEFFNKNKSFKIIKVIERQQIIENGGNGTKYYDLDVIYDDNRWSCTIYAAYDNRLLKKIKKKEKKDL